jgi:SAM-dependent methyltransferase
VNGIADAGLRQFARLTARLVVARPGLWRLFRGPLRAGFDHLAPVWESRVSAEGLEALKAALGRLDEPPRRILDVGSGTGSATRVLARTFPEGQVVGVDLSPAMVEEARELLAPDLRARVRFEVADASELPFEDGAFELVVLLNMIPFFSELARVTVPGGHVLVASSRGPETPIWTPPQTLRARLGPLGFGAFAEHAVGSSTALLARREKGG